MVECAIERVPLEGTMTWLTFGMGRAALSRRYRSELPRYFRRAVFAVVDLPYERAMGWGSRLG